MGDLLQAAKEVVRQHSMECLSDKAIEALRQAIAKAEQLPEGFRTMEVRMAELERDPVKKAALDEARARLAEYDAFMQGKPIGDEHGVICRAAKEEI